MGFASRCALRDPFIELCPQGKFADVADRNHWRAVYRSEGLLETGYWAAVAGQPKENVSLVERAIAAINARDIEGYRACCTENVKLETPMAAVGGVYEGVDGIGVS